MEEINDRLKTAREEFNERLAAIKRDMLSGNKSASSSNISSSLQV